MNVYENIVILDMALTDEEAEAAIAKIKEIITGNGGEVLKVDVWGRRKLSYEIKKHKKGIYVMLVYKALPATVKKLKEFYKVFDAALKYLIVKLAPQQVHDLEKMEGAQERTEPKTEG